MKRTALLCCAALWSIGVAPGASPAEPVTLVVDDDGAQCGGQSYTTIGSAVAAAKNGDTVQVCPGNYVERVTVTKKIAIRGPADTVGVLDCFLADEAQFAGLLDPARLAILSPPDTTADSLLSLRANSIEVSGLVVQGQTNNTATLVDNPSRPAPLSNSRLTVYEAAIETDPDHSGYNIHDNLIRSNYFGIEFGAAGITNTDLGTTDGRVSEFTNNCLRDNTYGLANQRLEMKDVNITGNESYRTKATVYEIGWGLASAERTTLAGNVSHLDKMFGFVENTRSTSFIGNEVNQDLAVAADVRLGSQSRGIAIRGKNQDLRIVDNRISHTGLAAVAFLGPATVADADTTTGALVSGNHLTMAALGIALNGLARTTGTQILDNELSFNGTGLSMLANNTANTIRGNTADGNTGSLTTDGYGIWVSAAGNTFDSNSMHGNSVADARDDLLANTWVDTSCDIDIPDGMICVP